MSRYQKIAIFILRLGGCFLLLFGVMGLLYIGAVSLLGSPLPSYDAASLPSGAVWTIAGLAVLYFADRIGAYVGRGLD